VPLAKRRRAGLVGEVHEPGVQHARRWESDGCVLPSKGPNNGGQPRRRAWREGNRPERTRGRPPRSGLRAGSASGATGPVCVKQHRKRSGCGSRRCSTMSPSTAAGQLLRPEAGCCAWSGWHHRSGIAALEDKIVQQAVVTVLNQRGRRRTGGREPEHSSQRLSSGAVPLQGGTRAFLFWTGSPDGTIAALITCCSGLDNRDSGKAAESPLSAC